MLDLIDTFFYLADEFAIMPRALWQKIIIFKISISPSLSQGVMTLAFKLADQRP